MNQQFLMLLRISMNYVTASRSHVIGVFRQNERPTGRNCLYSFRAFLSFSDNFFLFLWIKVNISRSKRINSIPFLSIQSIRNHFRAKKLQKQLTVLPSAENNKVYFENHKIDKCLFLSKNLQLKNKETARSNPSSKMWRKF